MDNNSSTIIEETNLHYANTLIDEINYKLDVLHTMLENEEFMDKNVCFDSLEEVKEYFEMRANFTNGILEVLSKADVIYYEFSGNDFFRQQLECFGEKVD